MAKKKRLPRDFHELVGAGDLDAMVAVFDSTDLNARDGANGPTALGVRGVPPELVSWLAARGADLEATDGYGRTALWRHAYAGDDAVVVALLDAGAQLEPAGHSPLHAAAHGVMPSTVRLLLGRGADPLTVEDAMTALERGLRFCSNVDIVRMAEVARALLAAGTPITGHTREHVTAIGERFEFYRDAFAPDRLAETDAGLVRLYEMTGTTPVPRRRTHDGVSRITVTATGWADQHRQLWDLLVPGAGAAATVQGEVIRVTGRLGRELLDNGGANWDRGFRAMANALPGYLASGVPLPAGEVAEASTLTGALGGDVARGHVAADHVARLSELAVHWVLANPDPLPLPAPGYTL